MRRFAAIRSALFAAGLLAPAHLVPAAAETLTLDPLDCVIEPRTIVKLGSGEEGLLEKLHVSRGDLVKSGQLVAELDSELTRLIAKSAKLRASNTVDISSSVARVEFQKAQRDRAEQLHARNVGTAKKLEETSVELELAQVALKAARLQQRIANVEHEQAEEKLKRRFVRSPVDGVIAEVRMAEGEYVHDQAVIMVISEISRLNVEVFAPLRYYRHIALSDEARVTIPPPIDMTRSARVTVIDRVFDPGSGTFGVRLEMANPDFGMPAGLRCSVQFKESSAKAAMPVDVDLSLGDEKAKKENSAGRSRGGAR